MTMDALTGFLSSHLTAIAAVSIGVVFGLVPLLFFVRLYISADEEVSKLEKGWRCEAIIQDVWSTGANSGNSQFIGMRLEVYHPDGMPYEARIDETIVPLLYLSKLTVGARVPVRVASEDRNLVALDIGFTQTTSL